MHNSSLSDPFRTLWPLQRDFTYIPRHAGNNRSRIDFFLISDALLPAINDCSIGTGLLTNLFDHKTIFLCLGIKSCKPSSSVYNSTLTHNRFNAVSVSACVDCYLIHAAPDTPGLDGMRTAVGNTLLIIRELNDLDWKIELEGNTAERSDEKQLLCGLLDNAMQVLPDFSYLDRLILTTDPDVFFEVLCSSLKNALISFQGWLKKT
jgi:hypothetical protein